MDVHHSGNREGGRERERKDGQHHVLGFELNHPETIDSNKKVGRQDTAITMTQ